MTVPQNPPASPTASIQPAVIDLFRRFGLPSMWLPPAPSDVTRGLPARAFLAPSGQRSVFRTTLVTVSSRRDPWDCGMPLLYLTAALLREHGYEHHFISEGGNVTVLPESDLEAKLPDAVKLANGSEHAVEPTDYYAIISRTHPAWQGSVLTLQPGDIFVIAENACTRNQRWECFAGDSAPVITDTLGSAAALWTVIAEYFLRELAPVFRRALPRPLPPRKEAEWLEAAAPLLAGMSQEHRDALCRRLADGAMPALQAALNEAIREHGYRLESLAKAAANGCLSAARAPLPIVEMM